MSGSAARIACWALNIGPGSSEYTDYDEAVVERTCQWLASRALELDQPWCLYVGLVAPHFPLVPPQKFYDKYPLEGLTEPKLHPSTGYHRHPWVEKQNSMMDSESKFADAEERQRAMASYYGLCSFLDHNIGRILQALEQAGLSGSTDIVYTSYHGDNVGAHGLGGKSNMYEESAAISMIAAGPSFDVGTCDTPVSLLDLSVTIAEHFGTALPQDGLGRNLNALAHQPYDDQRVVFSEYHAAGAVSGAFMIRKGDWKLIHYVGFEPEMFDLVKDPEETTNLANFPTHSAKREGLYGELQKVCDLLESDSRLSQGFHGLARCLVTCRMCAMVIQAAALSMDFSQSFDRRRHRPSQAKVGSTTQRRGRTSKPPAASERLTVSTVQRPMAFKASRSFGPA